MPGVTMGMTSTHWSPGKPSSFRSLRLYGRYIKRKDIPLGIDELRDGLTFKGQLVIMKCEVSVE